MGDWSTIGGAQKYQASAPTNSRGTTVTPNATAHTKTTSPVQIISAAANVTEASEMVVTLAPQQSNGDYLVDIMVGGAGAEVVIAPNLFVAGGTHQAQTAQYYLPIAIPAGTRISARAQCNITSAAAVQIMCHLVGQGFLPSSPLQRVTAYGANTATSGGVSLDPGGTANTKAAAPWTQITSSTTNDCRFLYVAVGVLGNAAPTFATWLIDIGIGASSSEIGVGGNSATTGLVNCPSGSRP
jgi:hypothetical protein